MHKPGVEERARRAIPGLVRCFSPVGGGDWGLGPAEPHGPWVVLVCLTNKESDKIVFIKYIVSILSI